MEMQLAASSSSPRTMHVFPTSGDLSVPQPSMMASAGARWGSLSGMKSVGRTEGKTLKTGFTMCFALLGVPSRSKGPFHSREIQGKGRMAKRYPCSPALLGCCRDLPFATSQPGKPQRLPRCRSV